MLETKFKCFQMFKTLNVYCLITMLFRRVLNLFLNAFPLVLNCVSKRKSVTLSKNNEGFIHVKSVLLTFYITK